MARLSYLFIVRLGLVALLVAPLASPAPAQSPQAEKRIALVVGDGAYANAPLATAANDAGLIAQTLQAAGFDVVGARDLDGDAMRKSFRDFMQKAESSGPGTVAMVYLSGYALQYAGENYFVPVDSNVGRDTDIPVEGLRLSDYMRQLGTLPLKAGIMVIDAARQQPFVQSQIASGLSLVEPGQHMLIAYNAAPGTVAAAEPGPYGAYAQALAEMIRTGGLPLAEVFNRVRLRVSEASKGGQIPWDAGKVDPDFYFFERGPDAPAPAAPDQVASIRSKPIGDLGAQDAFSAALERDSLQAYEDFLAAYPNDPLAKRVRAIVAARREATTWRRTYRTDTAEAYWSYLRRYPRGPHAEDARRRLAILTAPLEPPPRFAMIDYDVAPPLPDEIIYVDRPVLAFSDPEFAFAPPPPPPEFFLPPPPPDFVVLEPPPPSVGLFVLPQPLFVPIPVYVVSPVYVAPPPNNIIYNNIHNTTVINTVINRPPPAAPAAGASTPTTPPQTTTAAPQLPKNVQQRVMLIQQGKLPPPPSLANNPLANSPPGNSPPANNPAARAGTPPPVVPTTIAPTVLPPPQGRTNEPPNTSSLPVPGAKGAPPVPAGAVANTPHGGLNPNPREKPSGLPPAQVLGGVPPPAPAAGVPPKPAVTQTQPATIREEKNRVTTLPPPSAARPDMGAVKPLPPPPPPPPAAARPQVRPQIERAAPPPPPRPQMSRPSPPPPPQIRAAPPPPRVQAPPPPQVRAAPPPPPPRVVAPPPPPPRVAAPPPPPPPRVVAAPPPPPRPAPPAAPKKCPPNQPKC